MKKNKYEAIMLKEIVCTAYLKEAKNKVRIEQGIREDELEAVLIGDADTHYYYIDSDGERHELVEPGDGGLKEYYIIKDLEKPFKGVCVGVRNITIKAKLFYGEHQDEHGKRIYPFIGKQPVEVIQCALVYYANMRKRWVPLEKIGIDEKHDAQMSISGIPNVNSSPVVPIDEITPEEKPCIVIHK